MERNIYFLIAQSYIAQFYPEHEYEQTRLTVGQEGEQFVAHGRVITVLGWKALFQKPKKMSRIRMKWIQMIRMWKIARTLVR